MELHRRAIVALVVAGILAVGVIVIISGGGESSDDPSTTQADSTDPGEGPADEPASDGTAAKGDETGGATEYTPEPGTPEADAYSSVDNFYDIVAATDRNRGKKGPVLNADKAIDKLAAQLCGMMSNAALKELRRGEPTLEEDLDFACKQSITLHFGRVAEGGGLAKSANPTITNVEIDGDNAVVSLRFANGEKRSLRMVSEDGRWKLDANPVVDPNATG